MRLRHVLVGVLGAAVLVNLIIAADILGNLGLLSRFVGMLTDSRSFLSFPRHEYFRRILCALVGGWIEAGEAPADFETWGRMIEDICFNNGPLVGPNIWRKTVSPPMKRVMRLLRQHGVDGGEDLRALVMRFEQVAKPQDGALVGQTRHAHVEPGELPIQRNIVQGFFHRRVGVPEELLQQVYAQHDLGCKRRTPGLAAGRMRGDQGE